VEPLKNIFEANQQSFSVSLLVAPISLWFVLKCKIDL